MWCACMHPYRRKSRLNRTAATVWCKAGKCNCSVRLEMVFGRVHASVRDTRAIRVTMSMY